MRPVHLAALAAVLAVAVVVLLVLDSGGPGRAGREAAPVAVEPDRAGGADERLDAARARGREGRLSIELAVLAPDGAPAAGADIALRGRERLDAAADRDGRVLIDGLAAGLYALIARQGRATGALDFELKESRDLGTLRLARSVAIRGRIYDARGRPIRGAQVEALRAESAGVPDLITMVRAAAEPARVAAFAFSREDGAYELLVPAGADYGLRVTAAGFAQETEPARPVAADIDGHDFYLLPGVAVAGRVVDEGGQPVAGARVMTADPMGLFARSGGKLETATAADGTFALAVPATDRLVLIVRATGFALHMDSNLRLPATGLLVTLQAGFSLRLWAVDTDGAPAAGVTAAVTYLGGFASAETDENGVAFFENLPTKGRSLWGRQRQVILSGGGYVAHLERLDGREPEEGLLEVGPLTLERGGVIAGRVLDRDTGRPVAGARVRTFGGLTQQLNWIAPVFAESGSDGSFRLEGVPLKATQVMAIHPDYVSDLDPRSLGRRLSQPGEPLFEEGQRELRRDVLLQPAGVVRGLVVAPDLSPVAGAQVTIMDPMRIFGRIYGGSPAVVFSDESGRFALGGLAPGAKVPLAAAHRDYGASAQVEAAPGPDEVTLKLNAPLVLSGEVVDEAGAPVPGVRVSAARNRRESQRSSWMPDTGFARPTVTDEAGKYVLRNAPEGDITVRFSHKDYEEQGTTLRLAPGAGARDLGRTVLRRGHGIAGVVVDENGAPLAGVAVNASVQFDRATRPPGRQATGPGRLWGRAVADEQGRFALFGLREGKYQLQAETPDAYSDRPVVATGKTGVRIVVRAAGRLSGRVTCEGAPVVGASVRATMPNPDKESTGRPDFLGWARTDADGAFTLDRVPPVAPFTLQISHDSYRDRTVEGVRAAERVQDFTLEQGRRVSGIVVDERDRPVAMAQVRILLDGRRVLGLRTNDEGKWEAGGLDPGAISVRLEESGQGFLKTEPEAVAEGAFLRLVARKGLEISGRLLGADGSTVERGRVTALDAAGKVAASTWLRVGSDGRFVLRGLSAGSYTVTGTRSGSGDKTEVDGIEAGASSVEIRLRD